MIPSGVDVGHADRMAWKYRDARWVYDASRKFFLFGRHQALLNLALPTDRPARVLEIGCGTGHNLKILLRRFPHLKADGVDIAEPMLAAAQHKLCRQPRARLALGDAQDPSIGRAFGEDGYDGVLMSYSLSMVPDWSLGLRCALGGLRVGARLSVVDFGCFEGWGRWGPIAIASLTRHDAPPMLRLHEEALLLDPTCWKIEHRSLYRGAVQALVVTRLA